MSDACFFSTFRHSHATCELVKFIYSEKAPKFGKISIVDLTGTTYIGQIYGVDFANFVASSEYMNFTKKCHIFSFGEKKYVIVLLFITDAKKILFFSCAHCCFCSFFFSYTVLCAAVSLWLPHSGTYQNILTVRPEQKLKS